MQFKNFKDPLHIKNRDLGPGSVTEHHHCGHCDTSAPRFCQLRRAVRSASAPQVLCPLTFFVSRLAYRLPSPHVP